MSAIDNARRRATAILGQSPPAESASAIAKRVIEGPESAGAQLAPAVDGKDGAPGRDGREGKPGPEGPPGPIPDHEWDGTRLKFETPDGQWGPAVDLKGEKGEPGRDGIGGAVIVQQVAAAPAFSYFPGGW